MAGTRKPAAARKSTESAGVDSQWKTIAEACATAKWQGCEKGPACAQCEYNLRNFCTTEEELKRAATLQVATDIEIMTQLDDDEIQNKEAEERAEEERHTATCETIGKLILLALKVGAVIALFGMCRSCIG